MVFLLRLKLSIVSVRPSTVWRRFLEFLSFFSKVFNFEFSFSSFLSALRNYFIVFDRRREIENFWLLMSCDHGCFSSDNHAPEISTQISMFWLWPFARGLSRVSRQDSVRFGSFLIPLHPSLLSILSQHHLWTRLVPRSMSLRSWLRLSSFLREGLLGRGIVWDFEILFINSLLSLRKLTSK